MIELTRSYFRRLLGACALCVLGPASLYAQEAAAPTATAGEISLRVRMEWGGGPAWRWRGIAQVEGGRCEAVVPLGVEADEPGSMTVAGGRWGLISPSPRTFDGCDLTIRGPADAVLRIFLLVEGEPTVNLGGRWLDDIPLKSLVDGPFHTPLDDRGSRLVVRRAPGDRLRVHLDRPSLVFDPGETFAFQVEPHLLADKTLDQLQLTTSVRRARTSEALSSQTTELEAASDDNSWDKISQTVRVPEAEGVYDVVLELSRHDRSNRWRRQSVVERRTVQVVVLSKTPPERPAQYARFGYEGSLLQEIDPTHPSWWNRMRSATVPAALRRGPLGNVQPTVRTMIDGSYVELPPTPEPNDPAWQAYPLTIARPGEPHLVELDYPANVAQSLGISLVEPDAAGSVTPLGLDMGLYVDESEVEPTAARRTQRFLVWPKTAAPLLMIVNQRRDGPAVYGKIRVLGPQAAAAYRPWLTTAAASLPPLKVNHDRPDGRLLMASLDRPLFPENFGATGSKDETSGRSLDDWVTFYDGARRLVEYVKFCGYNGLQLTVAADGGAIYPSRILEPTPRYDDGVFFSTGQDPLRKDVVELLLRLCDREKLRFVPAVQFTAPLPRLEEARHSGVVNLAPLGVDGRAWNDVHPPEGGLGPHYNPLHPRVRQEMKAVVAEFVDRYGHHPSLAGLAVPLTAEGYTQLPGVEWGVDAETTAEYSRAMGLPASQILERDREVWLDWRRSVLTKFYGELAQVVGSVDRKLYLTTAHAWQRPDLSPRLQPTLPPKPQFEAVLREAGLDPAALAALPHVEYLRAYRESPLDAPALHAVSLELNRDASLDRRDGAGRPLLRGAVIFHEPQSQHLTSLEKQSPFQPAQVRLVTQAAASGAAARRPLIHALAANDAATVFEGGWLLPLGTHEETRSLATVLRAIPNAPFDTLPGTPSHVVIRSYVADDMTYLYVVNDAPWATTVKLQVVAGAITELGAPWGFENLDDDLLGNDRLTVEDKTYMAELPPYGLVATRFVGAHVKISNPQVTTPPEVAERLQARIKQLWARAAHLPHGENGFNDVQRLELTKTISLAEYRLQHGEAGDCARLLTGYWPRYLTAYVPAATNEAALTTTKPSPPSPPTAKPTASEASRRWWPSFFR